MLFHIVWSKFLRKNFAKSKIFILESLLKSGYYTFSNQSCIHCGLVFKACVKIEIYLNVLGCEAEDFELDPIDRLFSSIYFPRLLAF